MSEPEILFEQQGPVGLITLNRPKALNSLTHGMVTAMHAQMKAWERDPSIACVVIRGAGERAFCAGGDIRAVRESGLAKTSYARDFWHDEYVLNSYIKHYPKPYIALIHGVCMGGGIGVAVHGQYRVAGGTALFAMPETGIGFFPDVGGSYFLPRCPGEVGMYLGLTGARLGIGDGLYAKIATHWIPSEEWPLLLEALVGGEDPDEVILEMGREPESALLSDIREDIDRIFAASSVEDILAALDREDSDWAQETAKTMRLRSPTSLKLVYSEIRSGSTLEFNDCMRMEFRMACRILEGHDFYEGVRAVIVDKDNAPRWLPPTLAEVSDAAIAAYFAPLGGKELNLQGA